MHPPKKSSAEFDKAEEKLEEIRTSFIKHLEGRKNDSTGENEELAPLLTVENEPTVESIRMSENIGKSKKVLKWMEKRNVSVLEKA